MTFQNYAAALCTYMTLIPAAVICFLPMKNQLRHGVRHLVIHAFILFVITLPIAALVSCIFHLMEDTVLLFLLPIYFFWFHKSLKAHISKSVAVFSFVCALMGIICNITVIFDAMLRPDSTPDIFNPAAAAIQLAISAVITSILYVPLADNGSKLIDSLDIDNVWYATVPISFIFLTMNIIIQPDHYRVLFIGNLFHIFIWSIALQLAMMLLLLVMFYFIVKLILTHVTTEQRNRILEMQERQYVTQRHYIENSAKVRHDFKQTIAALKSLSDAKDYDAIDQYLDQYVKSIPQRVIVDYCKNNAVNALLNYYASQAAQCGIDMNMRINIPESLPISDVDLCGMIGNILDNAIAACRSLDQDKRWIQFTLITQHNSQLCVVATNSFDGHVRKKNDGYLSTSHSGRGIGLLSISSTAEKYGGTAEFSHVGNEFYTDIMIPIADDCDH
jgi:Signal transduction histidine kinase regulating citrate/malate metabolism